MSLNIYAKPTRYHGRLDRGGKTWPMPLTDDYYYIAPVDELFAGDRLHFPEINIHRGLLLRVTFLRAQASKAQMFYDLCSSPPIGGSYTLAADVRCPACNTAAIHPVTVCDTEWNRARGRYWAFQRTCRCGAAWLQNGTARWSARLYDAFDEDLPA